ncbi:MAG TPA: DUF1345 domain-containing protein [Steroidobacteraceae bacterium]|jgi:uncharacterized membrane protein|nr:DUF1345 domain-containing protein [Steroidobacteraceae bacterium]
MRNLILGHPRLWISLIAGSALFFFLPPDWSTLTRVLVCWNGGVILFLMLIFFWMRSLTAAQICTKYIEEDETGPFILIVVVIGAVASLFAIVEPLATMKHVNGSVRAAHFALAALTLIDSWLLVPVMFTTRYADMFYSVAEGQRPLHFPNTSEPVFWDFAYFSFTIAAACQTADVSTQHADVRRVVLAHTLISFLFNAAILGFAINVTAGLIGGS